MSGLFPLPASFVEIEGSGSLNFGASSLTGTRKAMVDYYDLADTIPALLGILLIDPLTLTAVRIGADQWPGIPFLYAQSVATEPLGQMHQSDWDNGPIYDKWKLTIDYAIPEYDEPDEPDLTGPEEETYLIQSLEYSVDVAVVPVTVTDTLYNGNTKKRVVKKHVRLPLARYRATRPKVIQPNWVEINADLGKINSNVIMKGAAGTVLWDGCSVDREVTSFGQRAWRETREYLYNPHGWNKVLHPDTLKWVDAVAVDGGAGKPYEQTVLNLPGA